MLAVEFDGDRHHRLGSARDRDRLRQDHLERMGWTFHRVWASAWFADPDAEADRIEHSWRAAPYAVSKSDPGQSALAPRPAPADITPPPKVTTREGPRPVEAGYPITYYADAELDHLVRWHLSDGLPLDRETRIREMAQSLGFKVVGSRIRQRLSDALGRSRANERSR